MVVANALICLIHQANYLLDQQVTRLEQAFVREGGYRERLARSRRQYRADQHQESREVMDEPLPCPLCGEPMARRTAQRGRHAGRSFWGCSAYPDGKGIGEAE